MRRPATKIAWLRSELLEVRAADVEQVSVRVEVAVQVVEQEPATSSSWRRWAACKGKPTSAWFPRKGDYWLARAAVALCETCAVRSACLDSAMVEESELGETEVTGIRGGLLPSQRLTLAGRGSAYRRRPPQAV